MLYADDALTQCRTKELSRMSLLILLSWALPFCPLSGVLGACAPGPVRRRIAGPGRGPDAMRAASPGAFVVIAMRLLVRTGCNSVSARMNPEADWARCAADSFTGGLQRLAERPAQRYSTYPCCEMHRQSLLQAAKA